MYGPLGEVTRVAGSISVRLHLEQLLAVLIKIGPCVVSCQSIEILRVRLWNQNCPLLFKNDGALAVWQRERASLNVRVHTWAEQLDK